jgi:hypothetical protein
MNPIDWLVHCLVYRERPATTRREQLALADRLETRGQLAAATMLREMYVTGPLVGSRFRQRALEARIRAEGTHHARDATGPSDGPTGAAP